VGAADSGRARNCSGCGKPLSRYNAQEICQACVSAGRKNDTVQPDCKRAPPVDGAKLVQLRRDRGWTQEMLADYSGLSGQIVKKLEQGARRSARISTLSALARALNVSVGALLSDNALSDLTGVVARKAEVTRRDQQAGEPGQTTLLRALITERHWQRFRTFEAQFRRAARELAERERDPDLAKLTVSSRQWERWYAGSLKTEPHPDACRVLEHMFGCTVQQLLSPADRGAGQKQRAGQRNGNEPETEPSWIMSPQEDDEDMERRLLLQSLAALGVAISPAAHALESIRGSFGTAFGHADRDHLDDWEETIMEYGYSYLAVSPVTLIPDLAADLVSVRSIVARLSPQDAEYRGWCRVGGTLSGLMAKSLGNMGNARGSRQWWNTAQHIADASSDLKVSLWVRGQHIIHGLYENRPLELLVRQARDAAEFARGHICAGLADVSTGLAQVSVLAGDYATAVQELQRTQDILSRLPLSVTQDTGSAMGWGEPKLRYTETWVNAYMGNEAKTDEAAQRALQLFPDSDARGPAQVKLMQAFARVQHGDISEGIRHAQDVYAPLVSGQRTTMVDVLARRVLAGIPDDAQNRPDVAAYRELVARPHQRMIEA
jgi:transcriptional regulator with XRE-family HTH domain